MELLAEWLSDLRNNYTDEPLVSDVRVGVFYTAVEISTADVGVAFTPRDLRDRVCSPKSASAPPAGRLIGQKAWETAEYALSPNPLRRAVGVATLNALSACAIDRYGLPQEGALREGLDALTAARIVSDDRVAMFGAFTPFIEKLKGKVASLKVIDRHRDALTHEEQALWMPPERAEEILEQASVVILSGSTLIEGGTEELLSFSKAARVRVMAGPTTPLWPRPFFMRGLGVLGGIRVVNGRDLLTIVGQGGSRYSLEKAVRKACVIDQSIDLSVRCTEAADPANAQIKAASLRIAVVSSEK